MVKLNALPQYLQNDIKSYLKACEDNSLDWDCWACEVLASINMALNGNWITEEEADELRYTYIYRKET